MKVTLNEAQIIKGKEREKGEEVVVNKDLGERLIEKGVANRIIEEPENRMDVTVKAFGPKRFKNWGEELHARYIEQER